MSIKSALNRISSRKYPMWVKAAGRLWTWAKRGDPWFFQAIYVPTLESCNRRCHYCPQSVAPLKAQPISDRDFITAVRRMMQIRWDGIVVLSRFNEPLLDKDLPGRIRIIRDSLPKAVIQLYSNGDLLNHGLADRLVDSGLDICKITSHPPTTEEWGNRIDAVCAQYPRHFIVMEPVKPEVIYGLNADDNDPWDHCLLPSWALVLTTNLDVTLCCHDYLGEQKFGNLREKTINEIWYGEEFQRIRWQLRQGQPEYRICRQCFYPSSRIHGVRDDSRVHRGEMVSTR